MASPPAHHDTLATDARATHTLTRWAPALAALVVLVAGVVAWPFTVDDAYVVARYAERIAAGHGYTFRDGVPSDGVTGPLLLVPEVLGALGGVAPHVVSKVLGLALAALSAAHVVSRARRSVIGSSAAWTALAFLACSATLGIWGQAGLETGIATWAFTFAYLEATARPRVGVVGCALALSLVPWLRPELVPAAAVIAALASSRAPTSTRWVVGALVASVLLVIAFRVALFGHPLALAARAKPPLLANGIGYTTRSFFVITGLAWGPMIFSFVRGQRSRAALSIVVVHGIAVTIAGGDWMPGFRLFVPLVPLFALEFGRAISDVVRSGRPRVAIVVAAVGCALPALSSIVMLRDAHAASDGLPALDELRAELADAHRVALVDVGYLAYRAPYDVLDLCGITDPSIADREGMHCGKLVSVEELIDAGVDAVVLHDTDRRPLDSLGASEHLGPWEDFGVLPVERHLAREPQFHELYELTGVFSYAPRYHDHLFRRRRDVRPR